MSDEPGGAGGRRRDQPLERLHQFERERGLEETPLIPEPAEAPDQSNAGEDVEDGDEQAEPEGEDEAEQRS